MKKIFVSVCLCVAIVAQAMTPTPNVGKGRIRVLANNLENYYYNYAESSRPDYHTDEGRAEKTRKIVDMMLASNADIFAFCEVEAKPIVLAQLADSLNATAGVSYYVAVADGIYVETDSYDNALKSGFIYRSDKVKPYGSNVAATNVAYYKNTMRIQAWEELATGERFTLSMNHFKAKGTDADKAKRVDNATWLMNALPNKAQDPDILIMGDLNCQMDEEAITVIMAGGYAEQLLRFDANAYSYCYQGSKNLIDHAFANTTMADQITGAAVWHVNTTCGSYSNYNTRYSDHDPYLVAINLGGELPDDGSCQGIDFSETFAESLGAFEVVNVTGSSAWSWRSNYNCAYINAYTSAPDEDWLVSPAFDFSEQKSGQIAFSHATAYGNTANWATQCQLLISDDYTDDVAAATWTALEIANWSASNYQWQDNTIVIPTAFMHKSNVHFAFAYNATENAPAWEIKNLTVKTECDTTTATPVIEVAPVAHKELRNGQVVIIRGGQVYTLTGQRL